MNRPNRRRQVCGYGWWQLGLRLRFTPLGRERLRLLSLELESESEEEEELSESESESESELDDLHLTRAYQNLAQSEYGMIQTGNT